MPARMTPERFWKKVDKTGNHWIWTGRKNHSGYGVVKVDYKEMRVHRHAWKLTNGSIENGLNVLHRCDVRACCNPDHLFLGTQADNVKDMVSKGRSRKGWY